MAVADVIQVILLAVDTMRTLFIRPVTDVIPVVLLVTDSMKILLMRKIFLYSNMADVISLVYAPFLILLILHPIYLLNKDRWFTIKEMFSAILFASLYDIYYIKKYNFCYEFSFSLDSAVEFAGILVALTVTEIFTGRKKRLERNTIFTCIIAAALSFLYFRETDIAISLLFHVIIHFILLSIANLSMHMLAIAHDPAKMLFLSFAIISFQNSISLSSGQPPELAVMNSDILKNKLDALVLTMVLIVSQIAEYFMFRMYDIDNVFMVKFCKLLFSIVLERVSIP